MKKLLPILFLTAIICLSNIVADAQSERLQLFEYFDNTSIPINIGAAATANFGALADANPDKMTFIKYHVEWGSENGTDPMNLENPDQVATRVVYYTVTGDPDAKQDGGVSGQNTFNGQPAGLTQSFIDDRDLITSPFTISVSHGLNVTNDTIHTHTVITKTGSATGTFVAHVVVIEKIIHFTIAPGISGDTYFHNVMKQMLPTDQGTALPAMNIGDSYVLDLSWALANVYDTTQLAVISFVQDNGTQEVYQAGYSAPTLQLNDAGILTVNNVAVFGCDSITPELVLYNYGNDPLTSCTINYQVDNGSPVSIPWSGNLATGNSINVTLPKIFVSGNHQLTVFSSNPNGSQDFTSYNDSSVAGFAIASLPLTIPLTEGFEGSFLPSNWALGNPDNNKTWEQAEVGGFGNSAQSTKLDWYNITSGIDDLYPPRLDLSSNTEPTNCTFDVAYAKYDNTYHDTLEVRVSSDCGETWSTVYSKGYTSLATAPNTTNVFVPTSSEWRHETIDLSSYNGQSDVQLQFHGISGYGNDVYIDNVDISTLTAIVCPPGNYLDVYPNPAIGYVNIRINNAFKNGTFKLVSIEGENVMQLNNLTGTNFSLDISKQPKGIYFLYILDEQNSTIAIRKIVLQ